MGKQTVIKTKGQGRHFKRNAILISLLAAINTSYAAEQANDDVEVIEVRGIRSSTAENLAIKRLSTATVDAITAEDIGKFPDKNVADSLQRVSGVLIDRDGG